MGKIADFFDKLKSVKHIELMAVGLAVTILLAVYFSFVSCSGEKTADTATDLSGLDYCTAMQIRLEKTVSEISGVGSASVIVNWDKSVTSSIMNSSTENPKATGALVVCDGAGDAKVKVDIIFAVSTLLDLSIDKIAVYPKN